MDALEGGGWGACVCIETQHGYSLLFMLGKNTHQDLCWDFLPDHKVKDRAKRKYQAS